MPTVAERFARFWWVVGWGSVRLRTTVLATVVVAMALAIGALAFVGIVERSLTNEVLASVRMRAADLGIMAEAGTLPTRIVTEEADDEFIQVVDSDGEVVASSPDLRGAPPLARLDAGEWTVTGVPNDDERFLAYAVAARSGPDDIQIILGRTLEPVAEATALVARLLAVGLPLMLGFVALTTWLVVGRALRPVERMRREVDGISARELHRRLETPPAGDEIARLARTMNGMLDRLEASQARQRQFVADTSHELRSPIASIRQQAEVALAHPDRVEIGPMADSVLADSLRLQGLVDDLLLLARADERILDLRARAVDLDDIVFAEVAHRRSSPGRVGIDLAGVTAVRVLGDERALRRVVGNLLDNAVRHAATRVAISLQQLDGTGVLRVDDDGPGVPEAERSRVFERFVRLDEARARQSGGVGLGLAIVSELLLVLGGHVRVLDSPLGGARFEVRMPTGFSEGSETAR
jgi:signal transduction histidine kinase